MKVLTPPPFLETTANAIWDQTDICSEGVLSMPLECVDLVIVLYAYSCVKSTPTFPHIKTLFTVTGAFTSVS